MLVAGMKNTTSASCLRSGGLGTNIHQHKLEWVAARTCHLHMGTYMHCSCAHVQVEAQWMVSRGCTSGDIPSAVLRKYIQWPVRPWVNAVKA